MVRRSVVSLAPVVLAGLALGALACRRSGAPRDDTQPPANSPEPARLAVLLVFDQMRADYLTRWQALFGDGGFRRLCSEGAWFQNCHYDYANTMTGPGHATFSTGCPPRDH